MSSDGIHGACDEDGISEWVVQPTRAVSGTEWNYKDEVCFSCGVPCSRYTSCDACKGYLCGACSCVQDGRCQIYRELVLRQQSRISFNHWGQRCCPRTFLRRSARLDEVRVNKMLEKVYVPGAH